MNVLESIEQANAEHTLRLKTMILNGVRDLLFGETAEALHTPIPPLDNIITRTGSRKTSKRTAEQVAETARGLGEYIASAPGQTIGEIAEANGLTVKEATLPLRQLIADKRVTFKGQTRARRYFARAAR